ncbi:lipoprotein N-acyltransferase Lnb domain-containing protein [Flavobacterium algicola]|uniref:lipoprotein N-acyltransferase Lnb domain-containing protein n=1 Tax=Flavobacterium algicola TaxID=556529 RepID=UPI001EFCABA2|nr:DUF4105 domain-containing protein [Flavobacterium algicola]MCG9793874.1 DUF4105 domain-containing protein [Flavobacterium algicola]
MKTTLFKFTLLLTILCTLNSYNVSAQNPILSQNAKVSILTCGTGNESYSLFGHTALRITDELTMVDVVYNYGAFDFNTPNFVSKFAKGDLDYFAVTHRFADFMATYMYEQRNVYEQELELPLEVKQQLFENLNSALTSGESIYRYKFIDKNCTSMVIDIINKTLRETAVSKRTPSILTYRSILYPYFDNHFYEQLGTSIIFGTKVDAISDHIFLPLDLMENLKLATYKGQKLVQTETKTLLDFAPTASFSWWNNFYSYLIVLGLIIVLNIKLINQVYFFIMGAIGILFISLGFYSGHLELANNYNVLLFNPLLVLSFCFYGQKQRKWLYYIALFSLLLLLIYIIVLINKAHFLIVLPLIVTNAYLLVKLYLKHNKRISIII